MSAALDSARLAGFVARQHGLAVPQVSIDVSALAGGIDADAVARVHARVLRADRRPHDEHFVVKHVTGSDRELAVYLTLQPLHGGRLAPRLLGVDAAGRQDHYLYLEHVEAAPPWPWGDHEMAGLVVDAVARLHCSVPPAAWPADWDYEAELTRMASWTLADAHMAARQGQLPGGQPSVRLLERFGNELPAIRRVLLNDAVVALHGDVHPGNVVVQRHGTDVRIVLLDWGRSRRGAAFEDVASWLQSVGYWEREPQRRHDTLLRRYLTGRGLPPVLTPAVRSAYWLAAGCNALAGALRYHLWIHAGGNHATADEREGAGRATRDWLRVLRRALSHWRAGKTGLTVAAAR